MTTQDKLVKRKLSLLELAEFLKNVSQACKINGVSRQHFYDTVVSHNLTISAFSCHGNPVHPDPQHAVATSFTVMYAVIGRYLGLGTTPDVAGQGDWDSMVDDISLMILQYLLVDAADVQA